MTDADRPITDLLNAWADDADGAQEELLPLVYGDLRRIALHWLPRGGRDPVLQPTAIAHEAYLRLAANGKSRWNSRAHFFASAAAAMRSVTRDHLRAQRRLRRGGGWRRVELTDHLADRGPGTEVVALRQALSRLAALSARKAAVVHLHHFAGLSVADTAAVLGCSTATVSRDWRLAQAWLVRELRRNGSRES